MSKNTYFTGQSVYSQVINLLNKAEIVKISHETNGNEVYVKHLGGCQHFYASQHTRRSQYPVSTRVLCQVFSRDPTLKEL